MLVLEHAEAAGKTFDLRLFATDVAEAVLAPARAGAYPASIEQDVTPERLERWFEREDDTYCVKKTLREMITLPRRICCRHELGTNAAKYGALSRHEGRLRVSWQVEDDEQGRRVRLRWRERHGPAVEPPGEKGFGVQLIERASAYELEGEVELDYAPEGLICEIVFPVA